MSVLKTRGPSLFPLFLALACTPPTTHDLVIRGGTVYDGSGTAGVVADVAIDGDRIVAVGQFGRAKGRKEIDASGLAVAPGFINMLSHSEDSLIEDPRSQSDLRQGVTLEVFGEFSAGPINDTMRRQWLEAQGDIRYDIPWSTLGEYLGHLEKRGIAPNVASFVGAPTVREYVLGLENRPPTPDELERMKALVAAAMEQGAMGVTTALIYTPATFAQTNELVELAKVAARYGGLYSAHMRSEGDRFLEAIDETLTIAREARIAVEIYHLKAAGRDNWSKLEAAIAKIEAARAEGLAVTADMYTYTAGATGFDAAMPPWVQEGGIKAWVERLKDPALRARVLAEMPQPGKDWENLYLAAGAEGILFLGFKTEALKPLIGKTLAEVSAARGKSPEETVIDLVVEDGTRVEVAYFLMSEDNVKKQIALPWMSFNSDAGSIAPEGNFLKSSTHPRAFGNFARLLGKYVRDERVVPLEEAIRRLTSFPAQVLKIEERGALRPGYFADLVIFDSKTIQDHATFEKPMLYATGMKHVWVNGVAVITDGEHTGATPGRIVRGPGWKRR